MVLPDGRDRKAEERNYLDVCHRTIRDRPDVEAILEIESFFDASNRPLHDAWSEFYDSVWPGQYRDIKGAEVMSALRDHLAKLQGNSCCYCRQPLLQGGYSRQLEHILPKVKYGRYSFHFWNIAVACERCNRIKRTKGHQQFPNNVADYPDHTSFTDHFHPRFHTHSHHVRFVEIGLPDCRFVIYAGLTKQGRQLVADVLSAAALETTREATDPAVRGSMKKIREGTSALGAEAIEVVRQFEATLLKAIELGAA